MGEIQDIFVIEGDITIINMKKFYDCLKLVKIESEDFKDESRILLKRCIKQCKGNLTNNKIIVLKNSNVVEWEFYSVDTFEEWLSDAANKELGIELIKLD